MEPVVIAFVVGAGSVLILIKGRAVARGAVGWAAHQAGSLVARGKAAIEGAKTAARDEWQRGRGEQPSVSAEPPSVRASIDTPPTPTPEKRDARS